MSHEVKNPMATTDTPGAGHVDGDGHFPKSFSNKEEKGRSQKKRKHFKYS